MNLVFVTPSFKTGGGNRVFIMLANEICINHNVSIVYPNNTAEMHTFNLHTSVQCKAIGKLAYGKLQKLFNIFKTISYLNKKHRKDYIIISDPIFSLFFFLIKNKRKYRFIQADDYRIFDDGLVLGKGLLLTIYKRLCLWGYKAKINFIFNSKYVYELFVQDSKRTDILCKLVHPAIDHDVFYSQSQKREEEKSVVISLVARKHPWKGFNTFVNVYRQLPSETKSKINDVILVSHDDLSSFDTIGMRIIIPANDSDIANIYRQSDIFISPSWWEGFGLPPLEAMSCGCAVITSNSGGVNEFAKPNENCLMFEPKNEEEFSEKMILLVNDIEIRNRLANNGRITAQQFTWKTSANKLIEILK